MNSNENRGCSMDTLYQQLTGIHVGEQLDEWDARGKGYYGEFLLFAELYKNISGNFKILMNLEIPSEGGSTTEIDLLLIHETGLYVFEAKHYKGTIRGNVEDLEWRQTFKVAADKKFPSPALQNRWHIEQLRKLVPDLPIHSFIVFTSSECVLKVAGALPNTTLCNKNDMCGYFGKVSCQTAPVLSVGVIDSIFNTLKKYSPMQEVMVKDEDNQSVSFEQLVEKLKTIHNERKRELERHYINREQELAEGFGEKERKLQESYLAKKQKLKEIYANKVNENEKEKRKFKGKIICACVTVATLFFLVAVGATSQVDTYKEQTEQSQQEAEAARTELEAFKNKWEVVTDFEINGEKLKENYVSVDYVSLTDSVDFSDVVHLSFKVMHNGEDFYVLIDKNSSYTIVLTDGRVIETPCYDGYYHYTLGYSTSSKTWEVKKLEFSGFSAEDIALIKVTNLQIKRIKYVYNEKPALTDYEIVLYKAK